MVGVKREVHEVGDPPKAEFVSSVLSCLVLTCERGSISTQLARTRGVGRRAPGLDPVRSILRASSCFFLPLAKMINSGVKIRRVPSCVTVVECSGAGQG